jgi:gamma-glutamyl:cysteine ligase YbdK (ATP-grasp superfamily)
VYRLFEVVGIELEYMLVRQDSLAVAPLADWLLAEAAGGESDEFVSGEIAWNNELARHVIEFKLDRPQPRVAGLAPLFEREIGSANRLLDRRGLCLMPGGMHPWMDPDAELQLWPLGNREIYATFDRIFSCRGHGWANLQSMHVNLPFADDAEFGRLHAAIRVLLPLLPGLTASSPVMDGQVTGTADNRLAMYRTNCALVPSITGEVVPEPVYTTAAYQDQILRPIYADLAPHDTDGTLAEEWVNARGAIARFERSAIEIRVLDVQECPAMDLALAQLIVATLQALCAERWCDLAALQSWGTRELSRCYDAAVQAAERADVHDSRYLGTLGFPRSHATVHEVWAWLAERAAEAGALDRESERRIEHYLRYGSLSTRLVDSLPLEPQRADLERSWRALCDCLAAGAPFTPERRRRPR